MEAVVASAFTVTAAFARKLHAAFACKGSEYGSGGSGGGSPAEVVIGCDLAVDRGAGVTGGWIFRLDRHRADIPSARRQWWRQ